jgi:NAD-dependent DNA ligase
MDQWPVSVIAKRLKRIYADKHADEEERADLEVLIERILEQAKDEAFLFGGDAVPLSKPAPVVVFPESEFVFAGRFLYGSRQVCEHEVMARGGRCVEDVHHDTDYLVVGGLINNDWKSSPLRHKILKAVEYQKISPVHIISEEHWETYLWRESPAIRTSPASGWFPTS